jgi:hypothetical protein
MKRTSKKHTHQAAAADMLHRIVKGDTSVSYVMARSRTKIEIDYDAINTRTHQAAAAAAAAAALHGVREGRY